MTGTTRTRTSTKKVLPKKPVTPRRVGVGYPHRVSLDLSDEQYTFLDAAAYDLRLSKVQLLRALVTMASEDKKLLARTTDMNKWWSRNP